MDGGSSPFSLVLYVLMECLQRTTTSPLFESLLAFETIALIYGTVQIHHWLCKT